MTTIGTLFSGGEGVGCGAREAGFDHAWGIEREADIASVAQSNGFNVTVADALSADPSRYKPVDVLHASPQCTTASQANAESARRAKRTGTRETAEDYAQAQAVVRFIEALMPPLLTLENVFGYRRYESFRLVVSTLYGLGYSHRWHHVNMADYGVPQTRKRLILVASRDGLPRIPHPTHTDIVAPMLDRREPWVGWYEAIADIIDDMEPDKFAPWQLERLPDSLPTSLVDSAGFISDEGRVPVVRGAREPANTIVANHSRRPMRAFIVDCQYNGGSGGPRGLTVRAARDPVFTITATQNKRAIRADVLGRVVRINVRGMARFQSFPDSYALPDNDALGIRVVGNAVPPLFYKALMDANFNR